VSYRWLIFSTLLLLSSCSPFQVKPPGIGERLDWPDLIGWEADNHLEAWPALLNNCLVLSTQPNWAPICAAAQSIRDDTHPPDNRKVRRFFETWFHPHEMIGKDGNPGGLITGYYEPLLYGSKTPSERYRYPLYGPPTTLLTVELGALYPELKGKRIRGRLQGNKVLPFFTRSEIEANRHLLAGEEILWVDDRDDAFFLHIQGSGRVKLPDGQIVGVGYSNQNGHPYVAIGRVLLERNEIAQEDISLFSLRQWLIDHPLQAEMLLNRNPSYVFFTLQDEPQNGPLGSLNVPLTAERSIAIDPEFVDLGTPVWLMTNVPGATEKPYHRLVIAQDTGGAIKGALRVDLFWGYGHNAEQSAGIMKERGRFIVLLPKTSQSQ